MVDVNLVDGQRFGALLVADGPSLGEYLDRVVAPGRRAIRANDGRVKGGVGHDPVRSSAVRLRNGGFIAEPVRLLHEDAADFHVEILVRCGCYNARVILAVYLEL